MGSSYTVQDGDCMFSIAKEKGYADWHTIYDDPNNAKLKQKREDPNILMRGDTVYLPDQELKEESAQADQKHKFSVPADKAFLNLFIQDDEGNPQEGTFEIEVEGKKLKSGKLNGGEISVEIPMDAHSGQLVVRADDAPPSEQWVWEIKLGHIDPLDELSGVQGRLWNLGHECGPVDNINGSLTKAGVRSFQKRAFADSKQWDGVPGPKTQAKLDEHHHF